MKKIFLLCSLAFLLESICPPQDIQETEIAASSSTEVPGLKSRFLSFANNLVLEGLDLTEEQALQRLKVKLHMDCAILASVGEKRVISLTNASQENILCGDYNFIQNPTGHPMPFAQHLIDLGELLVSMDEIVKGNCNIEYEGLRVQLWSIRTDLSSNLRDSADYILSDNFEVVGEEEAYEFDEKNTFCDLLHCVLFLGCHQDHIKSLIEHRNILGSVLYHFLEIVAFAKNGRFHTPGKKFISQYIDHGVYCNLLEFLRSNHVINSAQYDRAYRFIIVVHKFKEMLVTYVEHNKHNKQVNIFGVYGDLSYCLPYQYCERMLRKPSRVREEEDARRKEVKMRILEFVREQEKIIGFTEDEITVLDPWLDAACGLNVVR